MSGGVDSSVAAYLMRQTGFDCAGVTMKLYDGEVSSNRTCCSLEDVEDARSVAYGLQMPYYVLNFKEEFERFVMRPFADAYCGGKTPNPCIACNRYLKFHALLQRARIMGAEYVATGHYARIEQAAGRYLLRKGVDSGKDQSYVLYAMTQEQLAHTLFPLGQYRKEEIREIAQNQGFINAKKRDSQDICFVPDRDYAAFLARYLGRSFPAGDFVATDGAFLGKHQGIVRYTIGQRRNLGLSWSQRMYVCQKDAATNTVVLGQDAQLYAKSLEAEDLNLIPFDFLGGKLRCKAKIRYNQTEQPATVWQTAENRLHLEFDAPQRAITRGQAVVLYDGDIVLGGGTIL